MKKVFIFSVFILMLVGVVGAIDDPTPEYCENMGHTYNDTHCIFDDGNSCELFEFYTGECGSEYTMELACKEAGEILGPGYECCENLEALETSEEIEPNNECSIIVGIYSTCSNCGDATCDSWENRCNCPDDCEDAICDSDNLNLCSGNTKCTDAGGYWYGGECNDETEETCANSGETCGTIAGIECCGELECQLEGPETTTDRSGTCVEEETDEEESNKVCCHRFGYGTEMEIVNSRYHLINEGACVVPEDFVGGGREVVDDSLCENQNRERHKLRAGIPIDECPTDCTCSGSTVKCPINNGGREMTIYAGKSGNMIIQIKGVNMSTSVTLYKEGEHLYGVFKGNKTREIKVFPDQVREKLEAKLQARLSDYEIELDEDGYYHVQTKKRARLFFLIPVREKVRAQVHSETGEIIKIRNPWWGFLARDVKEDA